MPSPSSVPDIVAAGAALLALTNGIVTWLSPQTVVKAYNGPSTPANIHQMGVSGTTLLAYAALACSTIFLNVDLMTAIGYAQVPYIMSSILSLSGWMKRINRPIPALILGALWMSACLSPEFPLGSSFARTFGPFCILNGLALSLAPKSNAKAWGTDRLSDVEVSGSRVTGYYFFAVGIFVMAMERGATANQALGRSWFPFVICLVAPFLVTKEVKDFKLPIGPLLPWFVIHAVVMGTLAF